MSPWTICKKDFENWRPKFNYQESWGIKKIRLRKPDGIDSKMRISGVPLNKIATVVQN